MKTLAQKQIISSFEFKKTWNKYKFKTFLALTFAHITNNAAS